MTVANATMTIEVQCSKCHNWNRFHQLSNTHSAIKKWIEFRMKGEASPNLEMIAKCQHCEKQFEITGLKLG